MGSVAEAEDVVQDSYVKAYRALQEGQFDARAKLETWLHRVVVNASLDARRKRARAREEAIDSSRGAEGSAESAVALRELARWLDALPDDQRAALLLKAEGVSSAEIGAILGCTEGAVEQRLVRARTALRERRS